jgi:hypothetical protein
LGEAFPVGDGGQVAHKASYAVALGQVCDGAG